MLSAFRRDARAAWLRVVAWLNGVSASAFAAVSAAYAAYPDSTKAFLKQLPEWLIFPAAVAFFAFIHHALKKAKGDGKDAA